jgi:hypothetical protein
MLVIGHDRGVDAAHDFERLAFVIGSVVRGGTVNSFTVGGAASGVRQPRDLDGRTVAVGG